MDGMDRTEREAQARAEVGRDQLENGIGLLAEAGWTEQKIRDEFENAIATLKEEGDL